MKILSYHSSEDFNAGQKAPSDVIKILNYKEVNINTIYIDSTNKIKKIIKHFYWNI